MVREFPTSLRWRVVNLRVIQSRSSQEIAELLQVSITFVKKVLKIYRETQSVDYVVNARRGFRSLNTSFSVTE